MRDQGMRGWVSAYALGIAMLSGCPSDSAGPPPDAAECQHDSDCRDDGIFCNGGRACVDQTLMTPRGPWHIKSCQRTDPPCGPGETCVETERLCLCAPAAEDQDADGHRSIRCGGDDCDDTDPTRYPGNTEVCDRANHDEDCDPYTYGVRDADADTLPDASCCNGEGPSLICGTDCNDSAPDIHPNAVEACDGKDNDCDGAIDEGVLASTYEDADGDGYGVGDASQHCAGMAHYAAIAGDCDDENSEIHPGAFRCVDGSRIEFCTDEARWMRASCPGRGLCVPQPDGTGVCLPGDDTPPPECSDGMDNDGDGVIDASDPECSSPLDNSEAPHACQDGTDNDEDGLTDYPDDPGCATAEGDDEQNPSTPPACANGIDDDNDGTADFVHGTGDPGCASAADDSERNPDGPTCDNGIDDDGDGATGYPADKNCMAPTSDAEQKPACNNGIDDDGDGAADYPNDIGCDSANDTSERGGPNSNYACDNGIDDDGDGATDYPGDTGCTAAKDTSEM